MPAFGDRERVEEARYAKGQELTFRVKARRNKMLALWAAEKMGRSGAAAQQYAREFARAEVADRADEAVIARIGADLLAEGIFIPAAEIRDHLDRFTVSASRSLKAPLRPNR